MSRLVVLRHVQTLEIFKSVSFADSLKIRRYHTVWKKLNITSLPDYPKCQGI